MEVVGRFLEMLLAGASREDLDRVVAAAEAEGRTPAQLASLREQHGLALRVQEQMQRQRGREAELSALNETARDLAEIRDLDQILTAIVRRARTLLHADMTYLSLNDEADGASYPQHQPAPRPRGPRRPLIPFRWSRDGPDGPPRPTSTDPRRRRRPPPGAVPASCSVVGPRSATTGRAMPRSEADPSETRGHKSWVAAAIPGHNRADLTTPPNSCPRVYEIPRA